MARRARRRRRASARATNSFPVPDSPVMSTLARVGPTLRISVLIARIGGLSPTSESGSTGAWSARRSVWFSSMSRRADDEPVELRQQLLEDHGLHQVVVRTAAEGGDGVLDRRVGRNHHHDRLGPGAAEPVEQVQAVEPRQLDIAEGQVRLERRDLSEGFGSVAGDGDLEAFALEKLAERRGDDLLIVDDQDSSPASGRRPRRWQNSLGSWRRRSLRPRLTARRVRLRQRAA